MKLLEHEAKSILKNFSIPVPNGRVITANDSGDLGVKTSSKTNTTATIPLPTVLKSQVPIGGRGKAGGIKIVNTHEELTTVSRDILALPIKGFTPRTLLAEDLINIKEEFYISLLINRQTESIELLAHPEGGIEIEEHPAESFLRTPVNPALIQTVAAQLATAYNLPSHTNQLEDLLTKLLACFTSSDATLLEINPLVLTKENTLIAGDCKMTLDDSAAFRHPNWQFEDTATETNFVTLNKQGTVATIANGAGLAMATVDAVSDAGLTPANFLDIGGGANSETVLTAFHRIMEFPNINGIVINIFAGITRCDEVAKAIIEARRHITNLPPLYIRLAGTNVNEAKALLAAENIELLPTLSACLTAAKNTPKKEVRL